MALPATDSFTGSNGDPLPTYSSNWTTIAGEQEISSNAAANDSTGSGDECGTAWTADTFDNDQYAEGTLLTVGSVNAIGPAVRMSETDNYYGYYAYSTDRWLFKYVGASWTQLGSTGGGVSNSDTVRLEAEGTTITPIYNGSTDTSIGAQTDSALSSGDAGLCGWGDFPNTSLDDWEGGNLAGGPVDLTFSVSDAITVGEAVTVTVSDPQVSVADSITVGETTKMLMTSFVDVSDGVTLAEAFQLELESYISIADGVSITDTPALLLPELYTAINEAISVADAPSISLAEEDVLSINISDIGELRVKVA